jgi:myo-inositol-1(or 4)-monophosphatase
MKKEWKEDNSPVTVTDTTINRIVIDTIVKKFPGHAILGEEESLIIDSEYMWVCDPVDGTIPFSHGIPISTFSLALTQNGESIVGVTYDPFMDRMFYAEKGKGAFINNHQISVSESKSLKSSVLSIDKMKTSGYDTSESEEILIGKKVKIFGLKSLVYCGMLVACGEFIGTVFGGTTPWDGAAIKIIIEEAGGKVTDLYGNDQRYDKAIKGIIASNGFVHDELVSIIKKALTNP